MSEESKSTTITLSKIKVRRLIKNAARTFSASLWRVPVLEYCQSHDSRKSLRFQKNTGLNLSIFRFAKLMELIHVNLRDFDLNCR